ncbi:transcriptional repressor [Dactylosporangium sp. AC04546]|uniref:Fur family transcriptional regulator n=1 Tax=Dactylosporangium sp. AC04546 TaxID=2862460 RepID=UPI001EDF6383|nr:transcriptional repressor [Dactylosporangium sp. AC04546]WVK80398.1 transcriptional repressor [Dactylosporangium sp. AC04546]
MDAAHERVSAAMARVRAAGGRCTHARRAVLRVLVGATHLSAAEVHERLTADGVELDHSTVHRVLTGLARIDVVHVVPVGGALTYGLADHAHHHTVFRRCGAVRQLPADAVAALVADVTQDGTFVTDPDGRDGGVVVYGRCGTCPAGAA